MMSSWQTSKKTPEPMNWVEYSLHQKTPAEFFQAYL